MFFFFFLSSKRFARNASLITTPQGVYRHVSLMKDIRENEIWVTLTPISIPFPKLFFFSEGLVWKVNCVPLLLNFEKEGYEMEDTFHCFFCIFPLFSIIFFVAKVLTKAVVVWISFRHETFVPFYLCMCV